MLDQNTDRMWYVIGAVLIGGLIIAGAVLLFNDGIMEKITTSLNGLMKTATDAVGKVDIDKGAAGKVPSGTINMFSTFRNMPLF